jgi:hypothetical protein
MIGQLHILQERAPNTPGRPTTYLTGADTKHTRSPNYISYRSGHQTHPNHSKLCLPVASAETLPGHSDATKKCSDPSHVVHITFQGVSFEALARRQMVSHYCQTANSLLPANSRKFTKNSVLQVYNTTIHSYNISPLP